MPGRGGDDYALGRQLLVGEVNAAIDGALAAGATRILVNDAHSVMRNLPPDALGGRASYLIRDGVRAALTSLAAPPAIRMPATVEVRFTSPDMAAQATWLRGVTRLDPLTVALTDDDPLRLYQAFITLVYLTRSLVESY